MLFLFIYISFNTIINQFTIDGADNRTVYIVPNQVLQYTGCIKKKVIELQRAIIRESLGV